MPEIRIQIEDDEDDATSKPTQESIADIKRRGDAAAAEAVRFKQEAARHRADIARMRVGTALTRVGMEANDAAADYRSALEAGDIDTQTAAQARMAEVEARRVRLLEHEQALHNTPVVPADPVEAACAGRTAATANWLRAHPEHVRDPKKLAKLQSAHFDAEAEGLIPDTGEYFQHIERRVGIGDSAKGSRSDGDRSGGRPPAKVDPNNPNTHVMRGGAEVFLTKGEKDAATDGTLRWSSGPNRGKPIGVAEFARRKVAMVRQGGWYDKLD
jgi:hypothetical protein